MTPPRRPVSPGRAVLYVRVSALMGRGGDDFHSPDVQLTAMRRATAGMREVAVVQDIDRTGRHFSREGIDRIRQLAAARQVDAIAVYDVSRLGRNVRESLTFLAELADQGVTILSACEQVDTSTPAGRLMLTNMLAIAEYRSDEIGRGWSAAIARRAEQGRHHGHPLGYTRQAGRLVPDPILGPVVARAWLDYAAGVPIGQIVQAVAAARGVPIRAGNLKTWFRRPVYLGHTVAGGQIVTRDTHPPLVDADTWDRVQARLARDSTTPPRVLDPTWSLVGIAWCATCDRARLQRQPRRTPDGGVVNRLCCGLGPSRGMGGGCPGIGYPLLDAVEEEVLRRVEGYICDLRTDDAARAEQMMRQRVAVDDAAALRRRLDQVETALTRLARAWALQDLGDAEHDQARAELVAEAESLRGRLADAGEIEPAGTPEQAATAAEAVLTMWPDMDAGQRNRALRAVIARVTVRRAGRWREPESDRVAIEWR